MAQDSQLIQKQEELKQQLASGKYKWLMEIALDWLGRLIQNITRSQKASPFWYSALIVALLGLLVGFTISLLLGEFDEFRRNQIITDIVMMLLVFIGMIFAQVYKGVIISTLHDSVVDAIETVSDLYDLQTWLIDLTNLRKPFFFGLFFIVFTGLNGIIFSITISRFIGWGSLIIGMIIGFLAGILIYYFFPLLLLPIRLSKYQFKLYAVDPSSSEVIDRLSDMLGTFVYISAGLSAIAMLILAILGVFNNTVTLIVFVLISWVPLAALFITNQYALSKIIIRGKWRTLNKVQDQVEDLRLGEQLAEKDTMDAVNRLMDYHNRIKDTRNSAINVRSSLSFLNSLLLPLIAFLLANLDKVLAFFE